MMGNIGEQADGALVKVIGKLVTTVEGLGKALDGLRPRPPIQAVESPLVALLGEAPRLKSAAIR